MINLSEFEIKLIDFGVAKSYDEPESSEIDSTKNNNTNSNSNEDTLSDESSQ
jgi:hypothetical protein